MNIQKPRLLAIDDTPENLLVLGAALRDSYDLQLASSGAMGIAQALQAPPDLILLDIMMPEMDGFEVCRRLKASPQLKDIPVIFVTALNEAGSEVKGLELGAADYITKPVNVAIARCRIHNLLERENLRRQVEAQRDQLEEEVARRRQSEDMLRKLSVAVEQSPASVVITDLDALIEYVNPRFTEVTGYSATEAIGQNPRVLQSGQMPKETYALMWQELTAGLVWHGELINRRKNGEVFWEETQIAPIKNPAGVVTHYVALKNEITERKHLEEQVLHFAFYDPLTQLANRRLLSDRVSQIMAASKRSACYAAAVVLDLDNFKPLNDKHGHLVGDLLLIEVAARLTCCVRETDTLARFGGDEFVVMLGELDVDRAVSTSQALAVAEKIRHSLQEPYRLTVTQQGKADFVVEHHCTASIGVVVFMNHEGSPDQVIEWADAAMYQAKDAGRNSIRFYEASSQP
jgi:diguanylate cyclase (GGDEF)-like protein/PAS domain S-box-containing protein